MKRLYVTKLLIFPLLLASSTLFSQNVAINTTGTAANGSAILDLTNTANMGFLAPQAALSNVGTFAPVTGPGPAGIIVYSTTAPTGGSGVGYYYWNGSSWISFSGGASSVTGAIDGTSMSGTNVILGNAFGGTLGELTQNTEIPFNTYNLTFSGTGKIGIDLAASTSAAQALEIGQTTNTIRVNGLKAGSTFNILPAATTSYMLYANTSGDIYSMPAGTTNQVLTWSATGPAWGSTSATAWQITGNTPITASTSAIGAAANNNFAGTATGSNADFVMVANGYERMRIANTTGNVGVSNIAPTTLMQIGNAATTTGKLSVFSQDYQYGQIQIGNPVSNAEASMQFISGVSAFGSGATSVNGTTNMWNIGAGTYALGGSKFVVSVVSAGPIMTFTSAGLVGVGQTTPLQKFEIGGNTNTERIDGLSSTGTLYNIASATNVGNLVYANNANGDLWSIPHPTVASVLTSSAGGVVSWQPGSPISGSGTLNYYARWTPNGTTLGIGFTEDNGTSISMSNPASAPVNAQMLTVTGNATSTTAIVGTTAQAAGYGVQGNNTVANGIGVQGYNTYTTGTSVGVEGYIGTLSANATPSGVYGSTQTASTYGILGKNASGAGSISIGIGGFGHNYLPAMPLYGAGGVFASNNVGVWGSYNSAVYKGIGVQGVGYLGSNTVYNYNWGVSGNVGNTTDLGDAGIFGYYGVLTAIPNTPSGVMGVANVAANNGVYGYNVAGNSGGAGNGVEGVTLQTTAFGVLGLNGTYPGVGEFGIGGGAAASYFQLGEGEMGNGEHFGSIGYANNTPYAGVWGATSSSTTYFTSNEGVMGSGVYGVMGLGTSYGGYFENSAANNYTYLGGNGYGIQGYGTTYGGYFQAGTWFTYIGGAGYKVMGNGVVSTEVLDNKNQYRVLSCPEAPEVLFEDYGSASLSGGKIHINLDTLFANSVTINEKHPLRVMITLNDQCNGVYVTNRTSTGFDVVELNGGNSNASFTYEVIANRAALYDQNHNLMANFADMRYEKGQGPMKTESQKATTASPSVSPKNLTSVQPVNDGEKVKNQLLQK